MSKKFTSGMTAVGALGQAYGRCDKDTVAQLAEAQACWKNATEGERSTMRAEFMGAYLMNFFRISANEAGRIMEIGKSTMAEKAHKDAIDRANNRFRAVTGVARNGNAKASHDHTEVPAHILKLARALATACNEYKGARKLASTAITQSFAA